MAANDEPRYPSDLSDTEWKLIEPHIPGLAKLGRPPKYAKREIINAIFYLTRSGCGWRMMPKDLPPWRICYYYFARWQKDGVWTLIHEALRDDVRLKHGKKKPQPLRSSTRRVLRQLTTPECVDTMLERRLWDENDTWLWTPSD
jgi:transposase